MRICLFILFYIWNRESEAQSTETVCLYLRDAVGLFVIVVIIRWMLSFA